MDPMLLIFSVAAIALLSWLAGRLYPVQDGLTDERVHRNMVRTFPGESVTGILVDTARRVALVRLDGTAERLGLVTQPRDRIVCRVLARGDIDHVVPTKGGLRLTLDDFTQPAITFTADDALRASALGWLAAVTDANQGAQDQRENPGSGPAVTVPSQHKDSSHVA
ncbi:hypothetical protein BXY39_1177 [Eilatimonas milleporae]|uniref:Uncharacterized protein n=2 Tax=Eilatimonas milleporae TaxID=911205 RepID=A0A3M0CGP6_9PROT|nr:hypothetical protein BXY39_1177 [Eilatimonas milleporae]